MELRPGRLAILGLVVGIAVLLAGLWVGSLSATRHREDRYIVRIASPPGEAWTVWIPKASIQMSLASSGVVRSVEPVTTAFGPMENVSGSGTVDLVWSLDRAFDTLIPQERDVRGAWNLSTWDGSHFHIRRASANPNATIDFLGGVAVRQSDFGEASDCGFGSRAGLSEGWNLIPEMIGDCFVGTDLVPWFTVVFPGLALAGAGSIGISAAILFRRRPAR